MSKPSVGIFGLTGCAGDQLVILNCEDQLLDIAGALNIRDFLMASSDRDAGCDLDLALVEGAVLTKRDEAALKRIRERSKALAAIGTCAVWGGVAAMDRDADRSKLLGEIYGDLGAGYDSVPARALREVVQVDLNITGCPIEKEQFLSAVANLLNGDPPLFPSYPVCAECKMRENNCLLIEKSELCCGPLTVAGCDARCPGLGVPCVGCRGPADDANVASALAMFQGKSVPREKIAAKLRTFAPMPGDRS
ncbi:MAG: NADH:ubiquinone oxidoreductase [Acidobacteriota bacterium]